MQLFHATFCPHTTTTLVIRAFGAGIALPNLVGIAGAGATKDVVKSEWYTSLKRPPFQPPSWVFPVAWTTLYGLMGTASVLVVRSGGGLFTPVNKTALALYGTQLAINGCWSTIFFKWRMLGPSVAWILLLDAAVIATNHSFLQLNRTAGYLFLPYTGWCMFATLLSYSIWLLNYDRTDLITKKE